LLANSLVSQGESEDGESLGIHSKERGVRTPEPAMAGLFRGFIAAAPTLGFIYPYNGGYAYCSPLLG